MVHHHLKTESLSALGSCLSKDNGSMTHREEVTIQSLTAPSFFLFHRPASTSIGLLRALWKSRANEWPLWVLCFPPPTRVVGWTSIHYTFEFFRILRVDAPGNKGFFNSGRYSVGSILFLHVQLIFFSLWLFSCATITFWSVMRRLQALLMNRG